MSQSIRKELEVARKEKAFWHEFSSTATSRLASGDIARLVAVQELADRKLAELERLVSRYEESEGKIIGRSSI